MGVRCPGHRVTKTDRTYRELDAKLQDGAMGEIEVTRDQNIAVRKEKVNKEDSNLLQGLDIDESLGLDAVDEQAPPPSRP